MKEEALSVTIRSTGPDMTARIGRLVGKHLAPGDIVALAGELGSGKTCLTQGIARGIGVPEGFPVTSPTFTIINEYPGTVTLYHLDVYRLSGPGDLDDLGYEEYFYGDGVVVIEWAEKIERVLPAEKCCFISMRYIDENTREIRISGSSANVGRMLTEIKRGGFV